ncbi:MAG: type II toxin-antitoxin system VapC family toxin [Thermoguttaceae bacterium]
MATTGDSGRSWFVDANVFVFAANESSPWHAAALERLGQARSEGISLVVSPQILREFAAAASRPAPESSPPPLEPILENVRRIRAACVLFDENATTVDRLIDLLRTVATHGKQVHDANIVATMLAHGCTTLLTHNVADFNRFRSLIQIIPLAS